MSEQDSHDAVSRDAGAIPRRDHRWTVLLGLVGLIGGAIAGWTSKHPIYRAEALIHVDPSMPSADDPSQESAVRLFNGFMSFQVKLLESTKTTKLALATEAWRETGRGSSAAATESFQDRRSIVREPDAQHIQVRFHDEEPATAYAGVRALTQAYLEVSTEENAKRDRLRAVQSEVHALRAQLADVGVRTKTHVATHGSREALEQRLEATLSRSLETDQAVSKLQAARADATTAGSDPRPASPEETALIERQKRERAELQGLEVARVELDELHRETEDLRRRIEHMEALHEQLGLQLLGTGRIQVADAGSLPLAPHEDRRPLYAGLCAVGAGLVGVVLGMFLSRSRRAPA